MVNIVIYRKTEKYAMLQSTEHFYILCCTAMHIYDICNS